MKSKDFFGGRGTGRVTAEGGSQLRGSGDIGLRWSDP